jgi:hypothetical protein
MITTLWFKSPGIRRQMIVIADYRNRDATIDPDTFFDAGSDRGSTTQILVLN